MGIGNFIKGEINRKVGEYKENRKREKAENAALREARHREKLLSAPKIAAAETIERLKDIQYERKIQRKSGSKGGWRGGIENFAANMSNPNFMGGGGGFGGGFDTDLIMGGGGSTPRKYRKSKSRKSKKRRR